jgi:tRNA A22 N-methylase
MGTNTILDILNTNKLSDTLIISSNNHVEILREEVIKKGYYIDTEIFIIDKNKPYIIIKFKRGFRKYNLNDFMFGPILKNNVQYRIYMIKKYKEIIKQVSFKKVSVKLKYLMLILKLKLLDIKIDL